jgi:hypothetical protein
MNRKWIVPLAIGCSLLCLIAVVVAVLAGSAFFRWLAEEPENVDVQVDTPITVTPDETFTIEISVENLGTEAQILDSIDITDSYLEGLAIQRAEPPFTESYSVPVVDYQSYTFRRTIQPGETLRVQLYVQPLKAGDFNGEIDVCIGSGSACLTFMARTVVE